MIVRVEVHPAVLRWAVDRAERDGVDVYVKVPALAAWMAGTAKPTWRQLEDFAAATHVAVGLLVGTEPPDEPLPVADFRGRRRAPPSGNLLDAIYACQTRQALFEEEADWDRPAPCALKGLARPRRPAVDAAADAAQLLGLDPGRGIGHNPAAAWTRLRACCEQSGILVMMSGVVGSNNRRVLDRDEFRGFTLLGLTTPVIFVNGNDSTVGRLFTLAHELGHVCLGTSGVDDPDLAEPGVDDEETWCDEFAIALCLGGDLADSDLVPANAEAAELARRLGAPDAFVIRRFHDMGRLDRQALRTMLAPLTIVPVRTVGDGGGNFYRTLTSRVSKPFARAVVVGALEGRISYTSALRALGFKKLSVFDELARQLEVLP